MTDLIVTNGDSAAELLRLAGREATLLPWRDVLHEGPILPGGLGDCSPARVAYLASRFRVDAAEVAADFAERDDLIRAHRDFETVELWFEHDLYDQLQLVQVLDFFAGEAPRDGLVIVQADDFLGTQTAETILAFADKARTVNMADLDFAAGTWADLCQPTPERVAARLNRPDGPLPFLRAALARFLQDLPAPGSGLGRSERTILAAIAGGVAEPAKLFHEMIAAEEAAFMGDWSFFRLLEDLAFCAVPLIAGLPAPPPGPFEGERFRNARLALTAAGENVLAGLADHVALNGIDRWWAGTRLYGHAVWRFDADAGLLVPPAVSGE